MDKSQSKTAEKPVTNKGFVGSTFFHQLLQYVLTEYEMDEVFNNIQFISIATKIKRERESIKRLNESPPKEPVKKEKKEPSKTLNFTGKNSKHTKAYCEHIGKAVLAVSYFYRVTFKLKLDSKYEEISKGCKYLKEYLHSVIDEILVGRRYRVGKFNEFLVLCAFLAEVIVYMAFRQEFAKTYIIWAYFSEIFCEALKEEFEEKGGWVLLKQVSRPWWKLYDKAKKDGVQFDRPEYVYYVQDLNQWPYIGFTSPRMIADIYEDNGDSSDIAYKPANAKPGDMYKIACGNNGCYYFCLMKPKFSSDALSMDDSISNRLKAALALIRCRDKIAFEKARRIKMMREAARTCAIKTALAMSLQSKCTIAAPKTPTGSPTASPSSKKSSTPTKAAGTGSSTDTPTKAAGTASPDAVGSKTAASANAPKAESAAAGSIAQSSVPEFSYELETASVPMLVDFPRVNLIPEGYLSRNKVVRKYVDKIKEANEEVWNELDEFLETLELE